MLLLRMKTKNHAIKLLMDPKAKLKIMPGTQNGTKVKLKGKGFPIYKKEGFFGDLYITYQVMIPINISGKEKELFVELEKMKKK